MNCLCTEYCICRVMGDRPSGELFSLEIDMICIRRRSPGAGENENDKNDENEHENVQAIS
jgi:hypothetical protein